MIKIKKIVLIFLLMMLLFTNKSIATTEEVLQGQKDTLHIKDFAKEANEYTKDVFSGIDVDDLINSNNYNE